MKLALHTFICCCVLTTVLPLVKGATGDLNTGLKRRFRVWLQSRMKRDLPDSSIMDNVECEDVHFGPEQDGNAEIASPSSSFEINIRPKRSPPSKSSGCFLVTCAYHDLLHRLYQINDKQKDATAPPGKMGRYGRRRRSLQEVAELALLTRRQRRSTEAAFEVFLCE